MGDYQWPTFRDLYALVARLDNPRVLYLKPSEFSIMLEKLNPASRIIDDDGVFFWLLATKVRPHSHVAVYLGDLADNNGGVENG